MATRSTITLRAPYNHANLYRHWDGYPECTGRHLAHVARGVKTIEEMAVRLLSSREGDSGSSGKYEFGGEPDCFCGTEYHYEVYISHKGAPVFRVLHRRVGDPFHEVFKGELPEYRRWVANLYRDMIRRWKARNRAA